jgi:hypothetical protein
MMSMADNEPIAAWQTTVPGLAGRVQALYARVMRVSMVGAMGVLVVLFLGYVTGIRKPAVPPAEMRAYWGLSAAEFGEAVNAAYLHRASPPQGWAWMELLRYGDYATLLGICLLGTVSILCLATSLPLFMRQGRWIYAAIVTVQIVVLVLAASGVVQGGH